MSRERFKGDWGQKSRPDFALLIIFIHQYMVDVENNTTRKKET